MAMARAVSILSRTLSSSRLAFAAAASPALSHLQQLHGSKKEEKFPFLYKAPCSLSLPLDSKLRVLDPQPVGFRGLALRFLGYYNRKSKLIRGARRLYSHVTSQIERPEIYTSFGLEKNFRTTHAMLVLHIWMCLSRLRKEDKDSTDFGQILYDIFNHDTEQRVAAAGVKLLLSKWMRELEKMFYGAVIAYDSAVQPEASNDDLICALWRNLFAEDDSKVPTGPSIIPVQALAGYVCRELECLKLTDRDSIMSGNISFTEDIKLSS